MLLTPNLIKITIYALHLFLHTIKQIIFVNKSKR